MANDSKRLVWTLTVDDKAVPKSLKENEKKVNEFGKKVAKTDIKLTPTIDDKNLKGLSSKLSKLDGSKVNVDTNVDDGDLKAADDKITKLNGRKSNVKINVDDSDLKSVESRISGLGGSKNLNLGSMVPAGVAGLAGGGGLGLLLKQATDLDTQIRKIATVAGDLPKTGLKDLRSQVIQTAKQVGLSTGDVSQAVYDALSSGIPKDNVFDFVKTSAKTAIAGSANLSDVVRVLTGTVNAYAGSGLTAAQATDIFTQAVNVGVFEMPDLVQNMADITPIASAMKVPLSDATAWLAKLTKNGVPVAHASTMVKQAFSELSNSTSEAGKNFKSIAGKTFPEFIKSGGKLEDALKLLQKQATKDHVGMNELFGSIEAGQAILGVSGSNVEDFQNVLDGLRNSTGATDKAFKIMNEGSARKFKRFFEEVREPLNKVLDKISNFALKGLEFGKEAFKWIADHKEIVIAALIGIAGALGALAIASGISTAIAAITNPIGWVVLAVAGLIAAIALLWQKNEGFRQIVQTAWENIQNVVSGAWKFLQPFFDAFKQAWENLKNKLEQFAQKHPEVIEGLKQMAIFFGMIAASGIITFFVGLASALAGVAGVLAAVAWGIDKMSGAITGLENIINKLPDPVKKLLGIDTGYDAKFNTGKIPMSRSGSTFGFENVSQTYTRGSQGGVNQFKASGGYMTPKIPTFVGERGIETIFPTRSSYVANANQTKRLMSGGAQNVNLSLDVSGVTAMTRSQAKEFGSYIIDAVNDDLKKRGVNLVGDGYIKSGV